MCLGANPRIWDLLDHVRPSFEVLPWLILLRPTRDAQPLWQSAADRLSG